MLTDFKPAPELNAMAEQIKEQARGAVDTYFELLKKTMSSFPSGGTEFGEKLKIYSVHNIATAHEFTKQLAQRLSRHGATSDRVYANAFKGVSGADKKPGGGIYKSRGEREQHSVQNVHLI